MASIEGNFGLSIELRTLDPLAVAFGLGCEVDVNQFTGALIGGFSLGAELNLLQYNNGIVSDFALGSDLVAAQSGTCDVVADFVLGMSIDVDATKNFDLSCIFALDTDASILTYNQELVANFALGTSVIAETPGDFDVICIFGLASDIELLGVNTPSCSLPTHNSVMWA